MHEFHTGNIIRAPKQVKGEKGKGDLWIVVDIVELKGADGVSYEVCKAIDFSASNCEAVMRMDDYEMDRPCPCEFDGECEKCGDMGFITVQCNGWRRATLEAESAQDYIEKHIRKAFRL